MAGFAARRGDGGQGQSVRTGRRPPRRGALAGGAALRQRAVMPVPPPPHPSAFSRCRPFPADARGSQAEQPSLQSRSLGERAARATRRPQESSAARCAVSARSRALATVLEMRVRGAALVGGPRRLSREDDGEGAFGAPRERIGSVWRSLPVNGFWLGLRPAHLAMTAVRQPAVAAVAAVDSLA